MIKALPVNGNAGVLGAYEALNAFVAYEAVPCNDPVNPAVAVTEVSTASEPETITRFHDGILYLNYVAVRYRH